MKFCHICASILLFFLTASLNSAQDPGQSIPAATLKEFTEELISGKSIEYALYGKRPIVRIPNATGDELLRRAASGKFPEDDLFTHTSFVYGSYSQICRSYYIAYRVTGDQRFAEQLRQYARLMSWILEERPWLILPKGDRKGNESGSWSYLIPQKAATSAIFQGYVLSARLTLQMAGTDRTIVSPEQIAEAKSFLETATRYLDILVAGDGEIDPGTGLPVQSLEIINTTPYNQSFMCYGALGMAAAGLKDLQRLEEHKKHEDTINLYTRIVRKGIESFAKLNDVTEIDGRPYVFLSYKPHDPCVSVRDPETRQRVPLKVDGHPVFRYPEGFGHSQSGAWYLPLLWATDEEFGVSEKLLSGLVNSYVDYLLRGKAPLEDGTVGPPSEFISPWTLKGQPDKTWKRLGRPSPVYAIYQPFNPDVVPALSELNGRAKKEMGGAIARQYILFSHYLAAIRKNSDLLHLQR